MSALGGGKANELTIQNDMPKHLVAKGWLLGKTENFKPRMNSGKNSACCPPPTPSSTFLSG